MENRVSPASSETSSRSAYQPVDYLSMFGGYLPFCWCSRDGIRKWFMRWPSLVHISLLVCYVAVFSWRLPPQIVHIRQMGMTAKVTFTTVATVTRLGAWYIFLLMQTRTGQLWQVTRGISDMTTSLVQSDLSIFAAFSVVISVCLATLNASYALADANYFNVIVDPLSFAYAFACWHAEMLLAIPVIHIAHLAIMLRKILKHVNEAVSDMCRKITEEIDDRRLIDEQVKLLMDSLCHSFDLVDGLSQVYGVPIAVLYFIYLVSTIGASFDIILMTGYTEWSSLSTSISSLTIVCNAFLLALFTILLGEIPREATRSLKDLIRARPSIMNEECDKQMEAMIQKMKTSRPVQITAANFFAINRGLLTSIAGAVTTYLVVVAQFKGAEDGRNVTRSC